MPSPDLVRAAPAASAPTHARYGVIVFAVALAVIQYIDRVCISQAAPSITADLGLSSLQMGYVFSAFTLAYALFEIPTGWLGDKIGARRVVLFHRRDRLGVELRFDARHAVSVWSGRGGMLSQPDEGLQCLAADARPHAGPGVDVDGRAVVAIGLFVAGLYA